MMMMNLLLLLCSPRRAFNEFRSTLVKKKTNPLFLPVEITTEILSRLPIESIVECKRVCKTWRSLIDEPAFGDAHTRYHLLRLDHSSSSSCSSMFFLATKTQQPKPPRYTLTYEFHCGNYINTNNADDNDNQMGGGFKICKPPNNISNIDFMYWKIVGSSNGLICLSGDKGVYVYNPFTSEYVNLGHPRFKTKTSPRNHVHYNLYGKGFGYHPSTNEYKVVFIYYTLKEEEEEEEAGRNQMVGEVSVYTIGSTGTWRTTEEEALSHTHRRLSCSTPGVLMNGALHWIRPTMDGNYLEIVSFNLAEEKLFISNTTMPSAPNSVDTYFVLGLLGGCLCITQHNENSSDIWVMNNRDKSWTRKCRITQKDDWTKINRKQNFLFNNRTSHGSYDPIALLGNGSKILLWGRETMAIVFYDIETGDIDYDIMSDGYEYLSDDILHIKYAAIPYVRSIVSLKALGEEGAKKNTMIKDQSLDYEHVRS